LCFTLVFSVVSHGVFLMQNPRINPFAPAPKEQSIRVRYIKRDELRKMPENKPPAGENPSQPPRKADSFLDLDSKIVKSLPAPARVPPPYVDREKMLKDAKALSERSPELAKPVFASPDTLLIKRKVNLPKIDMARIKNPSYISYYQLVREKIRRSAYQNYAHNQTGEVYLSFIISSDGYVRDVRLLEAKSDAGDYLKKVAIRSVRDASPFPNFPKELDYPQLSFNIIISFEIE